MDMPKDWPTISAHFSAWRAGFLYLAGGIGDQPAVYVEAMQALASELAWIESEQIKAMSKPKTMLPPRSPAQRV